MKEELTRVEQNRSSISVVRHRDWSWNLYDSDRDLRTNRTRWVPVHRHFQTCKLPYPKACSIYQLVWRIDLSTLFMVWNVKEPATHLTPIEFFRFERWATQRWVFIFLTSTHIPEQRGARKGEDESPFGKLRGAAELWANGWETLKIKHPQASSTNISLMKKRMGPYWNLILPLWKIWGSSQADRATRRDGVVFNACRSSL